MQGMQVRESESPTNESIMAVSLSSLHASLGISSAFDILKIDIEGKSCFANKCNNLYEYELCFSKN